MPEHENLRVFGSAVYYRGRMRSTDRDQAVEKAKGYTAGSRPSSQLVKPWIRLLDPSGHYQMIAESRGWRQRSGRVPWIGFSAPIGRFLFCRPYEPPSAVASNGEPRGSSRFASRRDRWMARLNRCAPSTSSSELSSPYARRIPRRSG